MELVAASRYRAVPLGEQDSVTSAVQQPHAKSNVKPYKMEQI
jgi:hypothetical protein